MWVKENFQHWNLILDRVKNIGSPRAARLYTRISSTIGAPYVSSGYVDVTGYSIVDYHVQPAKRMTFGSLYEIDMLASMLECVNNIAPFEMPFLVVECQPLSLPLSY